MQITVIYGQNIASIELPADCPIENLLALTMADLGTDDHDASAVKLLKLGEDVLGADRKRTLSECGLAEGDMVVYAYAPVVSSSTSSEISTAASNFAAAFSAATSNLAASSSPAPSSSTAGPSSSVDDLEEKRKRLAALFGQASFVQEIKKIKMQKTPEKQEDDKCRDLFNKMSQAKVSSLIYDKAPALVEQYRKNPADYDGFKKEFLAYVQEQKRKIDAMNNQFSAEGQALLMEQIRQENCERLYNQMIENQPELMIKIHMLYVKIAINGVPTVAFIDSGAQISFMSKSFVEKASLEQFVDKRFQGVVNGIGGADRMIGRIHQLEIQIGDAKFDAKMDVMQDKYDVLIGLDFMRRHGCCIDLKNNRLSFNETTYADFLSDAEVAALEKERENVRDSKFKVDDEKLAQIMGMGFNKKDAEEALRDAINDVPHAVRILFAQAAKDEEDIAATGNGMEH